MRKYILHRSIAIFSSLLMLIILTISQLALSSTDLPDEGSLANCGRHLIDKSFGNMSVRYTSRLLIKPDESQVCNHAVFVCRLYFVRTTNVLFGIGIGNSTKTDHCTALTSQDFDDVSQAKLKAVFLRLASDESAQANGLQDSIQSRVVGLALDKKFTEARELLKSYIYDQIRLQDGN